MQSARNNEFYKISSAKIIKCSDLIHCLTNTFHVCIVNTSKFVIRYIWKVLGTFFSWNRTFTIDNNTLVYSLEVSQQLNTNQLVSVSKFYFLTYWSRVHGATPVAKVLFYLQLQPLPLKSCLKLPHVPQINKSPTILLFTYERDSLCIIKINPSRHLYTN